jgi:hypothetical protein
MMTRCKDILRFLLIYAVYDAVLLAFGYRLASTHASPRRTRRAFRLRQRRRWACLRFIYQLFFVFSCCQKATLASSRISH